MTKHLQNLRIEKAIFSEYKNKWLIRARDKKTNLLGVLVCEGRPEGQIKPIGEWYPLEKEKENDCKNIVVSN